MMKFDRSIDELVGAYDDLTVSEALSRGTFLGYSGFAIRFSELAREEKDGVKKCLYNELMEFCSVLLRDDGKCSEYQIIHKDFTVSDPLRISLCQRLVEKISHQLLRARLADLVWEYGDRIDRKQEYALMAIDGYCSMPYDLHRWYSGGRECWYRAARLAKSLRRAGAGALKKFAKDVEALILRRNPITLQEVSDLVQLVLDCRLPGVDLVAVRKTMERALKDRGDANYLVYAKAQDRLAALYEQSGDKRAAVAVLVSKADEFMRTGSKILADNGDRRLAGARYEDAERVLIKIPPAFRKEFSVRKKIEECRRKSREGYKWWGENLQVVKSDPIDISGEIKKTRAFVAGQSCERAVLRFASLFEVDPAALEKENRNCISSSLLAMIASRTILSEDGRAERTLPAYDPRNPDSKESRLRLDAELISVFYANEIKLAVKSRLYPAYEVMRGEHAIAYSAFVDLCRQSNFIPDNRVLSCARGLHYGWQGDFDTAAKLLIPQVENIVRLRVQEDGGETRHRDVRTSTEMEKGLSWLVENCERETSKAFGADVGRELKWLFGGAPYMNLRNHYAHGFANDVALDAFAICAFYVWWFFLAQVVKRVSGK